MFERSGRTVATWATPVAVLGLVAIALLALGLLAGNALPERTGPPVEEVAVERTTIAPGEFALSVRNIGPDPVTVAQVFVNDAYADVRGGEDPIPPLGAATMTVDYPWQDGNPYLVTLLTSSGIAIEHMIPVATVTPPLDATSIGRMALLGVYIGVVPVLLGVAFLPVLRRAGPVVRRAVLALTVGLLAFLAVDATLEGFELGAQSAFGGVALLAVGAGVAYMALSALGRLGRGGSATGSRLALLIAVGIGLHNLSEGLAVGSAYAVGELALGASLVVGFAAHNLTEGIAIVSPLTAEKVSPARLVGLGLIAGAPACVGAVVGSTATTPATATLLLGVGIGAIAQVVAQIWPLLRAKGARVLDTPTLAGLGAGVLVMYLTGLLVTA
ncbi:MAG: hypothetical protein LH603_08425 [Pseudonocardia sp.]|nr:hypothetical protein [Pseudonocardia sp.]